MGNQQLYADLHIELNTKTPAQVLAALLGHETVSEDIFRNMSLTEEIRGLVVTKHGLSQDFLAPLDDAEHSAEL